MKSVLRKYGRLFFETVISRFGYELKIKGAPLRGYEHFLAHCKRRGLVVNTVLDGGVGYGTPWLYDAFPDKKIVLFEPLEQFVPVLEDIGKKHDATYHLVALGSQPGRTEINVAKHHITSSSLKPCNDDTLSAIRKQGRETVFERQEVDIRPLDQLNNYKPPYLLKLDVEGFELDVLRGAHNTLRQTELIILEASLVDRFEDEENFLDICNYLDELGFALYEIIDMGVRSLESPVAYLDAAFVPKSSNLRLQ